MEQNVAASSSSSSSDYLAAMLVIVSDSFEASSQKATMEEKINRARVWARLLEKIVPADRLQDCFDQALSDHDSQFAINAYDLKLAWERIKSEEAATDARRDEELREQFPVAFCRQRAHHVNDAGEISVVNPFDWTEDIIMPCYSCRPRAYDAARMRFAEKHGEIKPLEILEIHVKR